MSQLLHMRRKVFNTRVYSEMFLIKIGFRKASVDTEGGVCSKETRDIDVDGSAISNLIYVLNWVET